MNWGRPGPQPGAKIVVVMGNLAAAWTDRLKDYDVTIRDSYADPYDDIDCDTLIFSGGFELIENPFQFLELVKSRTKEIIIEFKCLTADPTKNFIHNTDAISEFVGRGSLFWHHSIQAVASMAQAVDFKYIEAWHLFENPGKTKNPNVAIGYVRASNTPFPEQKYAIRAVCDGMNSFYDNSILQIPYFSPDDSEKLTEDVEKLELLD